MQHSYTYDNRNRFTNLAVNGPGATPPALASYAYTLAPTGHRLSGRNVTYGYDSLYRLTSETIAGDTSAPTPQNGLITYTYDPVGNRQQRASTVPAIPAIPAGVLFYDANDRLTGGAEAFDANGNTISSAAASTPPTTSRITSSPRAASPWSTTATATALRKPSPAPPPPTWWMSQIPPASPRC